MLFLVGFLLLVGWLVFYQKEIQAGIWGECSSCTNANCCGSGCDTSQGYSCNNVGYGICFCDKKKKEIPPTSTPGPRPPAPTQPGPTQPGGGGPTPTGGCAHRPDVNVRAHHAKTFGLFSAREGGFADSARRCNSLPWFCWAGRAVHECFTNARIAPSFVDSWPIRGWPPRRTINATGGGRNGSPSGKEWRCKRSAGFSLQWL